LAYILAYKLDLEGRNESSRAEPAQRILDLASKGVEVEPEKMVLGRLESLMLYHLQKREKLRAELASLIGSS
jgi:hypothetical protein